MPRRVNRYFQGRRPGRAPVVRTAPSTSMASHSSLSIAASAICLNRAGPRPLAPIVLWTCALTRIRQQPDSLISAQISSRPAGVATVKMTTGSSVSGSISNSMSSNVHADMDLPAMSWPHDRQVSSSRPHLYSRIGDIFQGRAMAFPRTRLHPLIPALRPLRRATGGGRRISHPPNPGIREP